MFVKIAVNQMFFFLLVVSQAKHLKTSLLWHSKSWWLKKSNYVRKTWAWQQICNTHLRQITLSGHIPMWLATKLVLKGGASGAFGIINASSAIPVFLARRLSAYNKDCCSNFLRRYVCLWHVLKFSSSSLLRLLLMWYQSSPWLVGNNDGRSLTSRQTDNKTSDLR